MAFSIRSKSHEATLDRDRLFHSVRLRAEREWAVGNIYIRRIYEINIKPKSMWSSTTIARASRMSFYRVYLMPLGGVSSI